MVQSTRFLDIEVQGATMSNVVIEIERWLGERNDVGRHIAVVNSYCVSLARELPELRAVYDAADLVLPDGKPFVFWMRHVGGVATDRICGPELMLHLLEVGQELGWRHYFYGGAPAVLAEMITRLKSLAPHALVVGAVSPPFRDLTPEEEEAELEKIRAAEADFLFVGLGTPKQDFWIARNRPRVGGAVLIGVGATFDFLGGRVKRAPKMVQRAGLEWVWRMLGRDRGRLLRRYTLYNWRFLRDFFRQGLGL